MNLSFTHGDGSETNGFSYQGTHMTTYDDLVKAFGQPTQKGDGEKTTVEWVIKFNDGTVATIYDWKYGHTPKDFTEWNIGGKCKQDYYNVIFQLMRGEK
jgi:hypothetical protein